MKSVRFGLADRLQGGIDRIAEVFVKALRRHEIHPETGSDRRNGFIASIDYGRCKSYVKNPVQLSKLSYQIDELNRYPAIPDFPSVRSHGQGLAGFNDHLIGHNQPLLAELNAGSMGILKESSHADI